MIGAGGVSPVSGSGQGSYPQYHGIFYGSVSNNADPLKKNRCLLRVPQLLGSAVTTWALPLTPLVDPPKVGTLVSVMFSGGDLDNPVYLVVYPKVAIETTDANVQPVGTAGSAGTSHKTAAADHVHTLANALETTDANIQAVASATVAGTSPKAARADHVHSGLPGGSGGFLEIDSTQAGLGDTQSSVQLTSQSVGGGQTLIELNAQQIFANGKLSCNDIAVGNAPSNSLNFINGGNTVPGTQGSFSTTWSAQIGSTVALMFSAINALNATVNAMYNNIYS